LRSPEKGPEHCIQLGLRLSGQQLDPRRFAGGLRRGRGRLRGPDTPGAAARPRSLLVARMFGSNEIALTKQLTGWGEFRPSALGGGDWLPSPATSTASRASAARSGGRNTACPTDARSTARSGRPGRSAGARRAATPRGARRRRGCATCSARRALLVAAAFAIESPGPQCPQTVAGGRDDLGVGWPSRSHS